MIGDNINTDILGAQSSGLDTLLFNRWQVDASDIRPTFTVSALKDIQDML